MDPHGSESRSETLYKTINYRTADLGKAIDLSITIQAIELSNYQLSITDNITGCPPLANSNVAWED